MRIFSLFSIVALAALTFVGNIPSRVADFALGILPTLVSPNAAFVIDNSHPRSPLASMRAGLA